MKRKLLGCFYHKPNKICFKYAKKEVDMFKKSLFIGLVCIGVTFFMVSQASAGCCCNPRFCASWLRGDVRCDLSVFDERCLGVRFMSSVWRGRRWYPYGYRLLCTR